VERELEDPETGETKKIVEGHAELTLGPYWVEVTDDEGNRFISRDVIGYRVESEGNGPARVSIELAGTVDLVDIEDWPEDA